MHYQYANIAVDLPIQGLFTYRIPERLRVNIKAGVRVKVSFRKREITGYVMGLTNDISEEIAGKALDIKCVIDPYPVIGKDIIELVTWMASYYKCPVSEILAAALPIDANIKTVKYISLIKGIDLSKIKRLSKKQRAIIDVIRDDGISINDLPDSINAPHDAIKGLITKGVMQVEERDIFRRPSGSLNLPHSHIHIGSLTKGQGEAYKRIISSIDHGKFSAILLHGITGSGKTEVYIHAIAYALSLGKEALVLVPEIGITPQFIERFKIYFGDKIAVLHSGLSAGERFDEWRRIREGKASICIGTRSALFAPFNKLGIIIIDEEHDQSYKQDVSPSYNARDSAIVRGKISHSLVLLGSATPSIESYYNSQTGKYLYLHLPERAGGGAIPNIHIVDKKKIEGRKILTPVLVTAVKERLEKGEQTILFLNRRGSAAFLQCMECGYVYNCKHCSVSLTFHASVGRLVCHYCNYSIKPEKSCPFCKSRKVYHCGIGTQRLEAETKQLFPAARIFRMDRDTLKGKDAYYNAINMLMDRKVDILIGTQMVTKGHDLPGVTLVGAVMADASLNIPDFRSSERTFQMIMQAAGRSGRATSKGEVIIQTYNPSHYTIEAIKQHDFFKFYNDEIAFRKEWNYPPFSRIAAIKIDSDSEERGGAFVTAVHKILSSLCKHGEGIEVKGPSKSAIYKIKNRFRWVFMMKSIDANRLGAALSRLSQVIERDKLKKKGTNIFFDVDPVEIL